MLREKEKKQGWYIYVIGASGNNYKIGIGRNPFKRLKELNTANPIRLRLISTSYVHSMENALRIEKEIHKVMKRF